ncbi:MAG: formylmethanofuran dehydrogenase [Leptolinea sp.]|nr:formylmethanofuran dehydrogenase [Leptolinea sp.]
MNIDVSKVQAFHGHLCPGLAIGIRVAEQALLEMGERPGDEEVVALVETNNCAVDAIQYITGCTFGKGNLIYLDYGKNAFRFIRRSDSKAIRIVMKPDAIKPAGAEESALMKRVRVGDVSEEEEKESARLRQQRIETILSMPLSDLVEVKTIEPEIPPRARIFNSVVCDACGEKTMEPRLRLLEGKLFCPECFEKQMKS